MLIGAPYDYMVKWITGAGHCHKGYDFERFPFGKATGRMSCVRLDDGVWVGLDANLKGPGGEYLNFRDPDGNLVMMWSPPKSEEDQA